MTGRNLILICFVAIVCAQGCAKKKRVAIPPPPPQPTIQDKDEARKLANLAQEQEQKGNTDEAIQLYRQAVTYDREMAQAWNNLGVLHIQRREYPDAVEALNIAAELWPTDPRPPANIGSIWLELGYARLAMEQFEAALLRDPVDIHSLRGAIRAAQLLDIANEQTSEWIQTAIFTERDQEWSDYFQVQRSRVDGRLEMERRAGRP